MKKRVMAYILAGLLAFSLTACGGSDTPTDATDATTTTSQTRISYESDENVISAVEELAEEVKDETLTIDKKIKWLSWWEIQDTNAEVELFKSIYGIPEEGDTSYGEDANHIFVFENVAYDQRYERLSALIQSGDSPDMFVFETQNYPYSVYKRLFQPIDDVVNLADPKWDDTRDVIEMFNWGGNNYTPVVQVNTHSLLFYKNSVIEENGLEDPYELYKNGEWTWDTFLEMCKKFSSPADSKYCIDGWYVQAGLLGTTGVPLIGLENGKVVQNLYSPEIERAMNLIETLRVQEYAYPRGVLNNYSVNIAAWASGDTLFFNEGQWALEKSGGIASYISRGKWDEDEVFFVPFPRDPNASEYYQLVKQDSFMLVSGAQNIDGYKAFIDCCLASSKDPNVKATAREKQLNDHEFTNAHLDLIDEITTQLSPVFDFKNGIGEDISSSGNGENPVEILTAQPYLVGEFSYTQLRSENEGAINARLEEINAAAEAG